MAGAVTGAARVARLLGTVFPRLLRIGVALEQHEVNGQPGALLRDREGRVLQALVLDVLDGRVQHVHGVINPDKLGHLGPVADAWAVDREVRRARKRSR
ncbi:hypothetical protein [Nocardiopsis sp. HUAS JQ3]|uniref:hypothetical protein n=1 Tax=Nocardiopsis sp. HUAS JQ3 TaxID=3061629 RepID=UPI0023A96813|nr:hypothetical protein [Nocardiopsis sp. HUAS JQ3]WDZ93357.1 hypothetical protein PV789_12830 [Nocardiopsis sp. HUAS JQ3]